MSLEVHVQFSARLGFQTIPNIRSPNWKISQLFIGIGKPFFKCRSDIVTFYVD